MPQGEGSGPKRSGADSELEHALDEAIARLDVGYKEMRGGKLYLAREAGTKMGAVPFDLYDPERMIITGPDGARFDLINMQYTGEDGLYEYLERMTGTKGVKMHGKAKGRPN